MRVLLLAASVAAFSAAPAFAAPALSGKWRIVALSGAQDLDAAKTRAEFAANGRFASTIGCNRIAGTPAISDGKLTFGPMMTTRMACPPPLDGVERQYLSALEATRGYRLEGGRLVFLDDGGQPLVTLAREKPRILTRP
ncbi:MAG: META domain-containing protein [Methylocystis sp.]|uniref:META domain-containing protein n=1 Tax=Methylocystis sp. TaxID=1911079 RepID=UPI003DA39099